MLFGGIGNLFSRNSKQPKTKSMVADVLPTIGSMLGMYIGGPSGAMVGSKLGQAGSNAITGKKTSEGVTRPRKGQSQFDFWMNNAMDASGSMSGNKGISFGNLFKRTY